MSSSERHSAMDLMFLKAASLAPVQSSQMAWEEREVRDMSRDKMLLELLPG